MHSGAVSLGCAWCEQTQRGDAWARFIASLRRWDFFGGLTFDPKRRIRVRGQLPPGQQRGRQRLREGPRLTDDGRLRLEHGRLPSDVAKAALRGFYRDMEQELGRRLVAVTALEYHKSGEPHWHPLIAVEGGILGREREVLRNGWESRWGFARLDRPRSIGDVAAYASKYLVKDVEVGDVVFWPPRGSLAALAASFGGRR